MINLSYTTNLKPKSILFRFIVHILLDLIILLQEPAKSVFCVSGWECVLWRPGAGAGRRGRPHKSLRLPGEPGSVAGAASPEPEPGELGGGGEMMCVMDIFMGWGGNNVYEIETFWFIQSINLRWTNPNQHKDFFYLSIWIIVILGHLYVFRMTFRHFSADSAQFFCSIEK